MVVPTADIECAIDEIRAATSDPHHGIHGPRSMSWEIDREAVLFLAGGRAALLQLAHPFVAAAIDEHSRTRADVAGRFRRTFEAVYAICFGTLEDAFTAARRVDRIHSHIAGVLPEDVGRWHRGDPYSARDPDALMWVLATLVSSAVIAFEHVVRPLAPFERDRYLAESRRFGALFGVPDSLFPDDWPAFERYMDDMVASDELGFGEASKSLARFLLAPPTPWHRPVSRWYRVMTTGLLPARFREELDLAWGGKERLVFAASARVLPRTYRALPARLRHVPAYVEANKRLRGEHPHDRVGRTIERLFIRSMERS